MKIFASLLALVAAAVAIPLDIDKRATTMCGQWDSIVEGQYTIYNNQWGIAAATSGSQCTTFSSISGTTVKWSTAWTWVGGSSSVKSYTELTYLPNKALSAIKTIPSTWSWSYTGSNIVADVSYDMWLGSSSTASPDFEIMVWLAALGGAGPISSTGSPIATISIAGHTWNLFKGQNGSFTVFSFVATSQVTSFSGDIKAFFTYLTSNQGVSTSQVLQSIDSGTEPFTGSNAVLTSTYSVTMT